MAIFKYDINIKHKSNNTCKAALVSYLAEFPILQESLGEKVLWLSTVN